MGHDLYCALFSDEVAGRGYQPLYSLCKKVTITGKGYLKSCVLKAEYHSVNFLSLISFSMETKPSMQFVSI